MFDQDLYQRAWLYAAESHKGQTLPGTELPYIVHVASVAMEVVAAAALEGPDFDGNLAVCCALLHDVIEDTGLTREALDREFGAEVAAGAAALSKDPALPKEARMAASLALLLERPREVRCVKLADRIVNLQPPPAYWTSEKCLAYRDEARLILAALAGSSPFLEARLAAKIEEYAPFVL